MSARSLRTLSSRIVACRRCPRLVNYLATLHRAHPDWRCRPVPGWGDAHARLLVVGLAPAAGGANRTGRLFTGDLSGGSGHWVYGMLHELGMANRAEATHLQDGLRLKEVYISAVARCAPPLNQPTSKEISACTPYLQQELEMLKRLRAVLALGKIAHDTLLKLHGLSLAAHPFMHGAAYVLRPGLILLDSYHPSRQNTFTKRLTWPMWKAVWSRAARIARTTERS